MLLGPVLISPDTPWAHFGLADPVRLDCMGKHIDVTHGHANPLVTDFDGDGKVDLLVGQFEGGKLRVYLNRSYTKPPELQESTWFKAGGTEATVPYG